jgi:Uma2 family endonuclease
LPYLLTKQLPPELVAVGEFEAVLEANPLTIRVPDVLVAPSDLIEANIPRVGAGQVSLVVEVLSEGTKRVDRLVKLHEYAEAGIEHYWIVDLDKPISLLAYRLIDGEYEDFGEQSGEVSLDVAGTVVKLDLDALVDPRAQR